MHHRIFLALVALWFAAASAAAQNVVLLYADDIGYGDLSCYGATRVQTPHCDRLAAEGLRFTDAHSAAATCTPSRYALLTGEYAWRRPGTGIARGDAPLIIDPDRSTLFDLLQDAGLATGIVGKWHLGLGAGDLDWNGEIKPGPLELGFDYAFLIPATGDRTPCVYVENHRVVGLDPSDPLRVSFNGPIGDEPTGRDRPDLLTMHPSHGHDQTIVHGVSRIGYMSGGRAARWNDETMADELAARSVAFIERNRDRQFALFFSAHDIHVPRIPHPRFRGTTDMGPRGDAIVQFDWCVGEILAALDQFGLTEETLVLLTSDNGPVVDDGYQDEAVERLGDHRPAGPWRGGKYSKFEGGTRVPLIVRRPGAIAHGVSNALVSQVDFFASATTLLNVEPLEGAAPDSVDVAAALVGQSEQGRETLVEQGNGLALRRGDWKYIPPSRGAAINRNTNTELANDAEPQLYDLAGDPGETTNVAAEHPDLLVELQSQLAAIQAGEPESP